MAKQHVLSVISVVFFVLLAYGSDTKDTTTAAEKAEQKQIDETQTVQLMGWLAKVRDNCAAYKAAPNDIKKSAIFRTNEAVLRKVRLTNVRGKLTTLTTNQGGKELRIGIDVGSVKFKTESLMSPIRRGSKVYNQATEMSEGQCVIFSVRKIESSSMMEQSQVCSEGYFAKFTDLKPCP